MPRIGVYSFDYDLLSALLESEWGVCNRMLLHHLICQPIWAMRQDYIEGKGNPYIIRERFRKWCDQLEKDLGGWVPLPSWEDLVEDEWECGLDDFLYSDASEWILFGDNVDIAIDMVEELYDHIVMGDDADDVVNLILARDPGIKELMLYAKDLDAIYVIRSDNVENCSIDLDDIGNGLHAFSDLGNGEREGVYPTYVLPDDIVEHVAAIRAEDEKRRLEREARSAS